MGGDLWADRSLDVSEPAPILIFDSGLGGLTVHDQIRRLMPELPLAYLADDAAFPYGNMTERVCQARVLHVISRAIAALTPCLVVIACNTASTIAIAALRQAHALPFVGTVPAVKPAAAASRSGLISVLGTPATITRDYTHDLIATHAAACKVKLVGAARLARLAEDYLTHGKTQEEAVRAEIAPCFVKDGSMRTDAIALACTHYPLLLPVFERVAPWPVQWIDPAPAVARRAQSLLGSQAGSAAQSQTAFYLTGGKPPAAHLANALVQRGLIWTPGLALPLELVATG
jgi:glutamate racemase